MANSDDQTGEMSDGLQVELFHPESDREPGDTNIQAAGFDIHPVVFPVALVIIALFIAVTILLGDTAVSAYTWLFNTIGDTFGWFYLLAVNVFIITLLYFAFSKYGNIRIGGVEAEKEFSDFSWMAMLFSAGMGIGLMFFSVSEPLYYFQNPPSFFGAEAGTGAAASAAMAQTFFHWGFHPWAVYGLVGLGLAFFSFNRGLPLTFRSIFWPLLGERIYGWPGHIIDLVTVFATLFGLSTSLGLGVAQVNTGLSYVGGDMLGAVSVPTGTWPQVALIAGITLIATLSVAAGLDGGVKRLSTLNLYLMFALLGSSSSWVRRCTSSGRGPRASGPTSETFWRSGSLPGRSTKRRTGPPPPGPCSTGLVDRVVAVRRDVHRAHFEGSVRPGVCTGRAVPSIDVLDALALGVRRQRDVQLPAGERTGAGDVQRGRPDRRDVRPAGAVPAWRVSGLIATLLVITFFVTSSDSGSLVIDHLTSGGKHDVPRTQRIFWALTEGLVASILLIGGGLTALQTAAITTGLPFAFILCLMCYTVYLGLDNEYQILESEEFAETIQDLSERDDVDVVTAGDEMVTDISDPGDDTATGTD